METNRVHIHVSPATDAFIVTDMQNDTVLPSGPFHIVDAEQLIPGINRVSQSFPFRSQIYTLDWHPSSHCSFDVNGGDFAVHCVQGTAGAELHKDMCVNNVTHFLYKATNPTVDCYSAFQDTAGNATRLHAWLTEEGIKRVFVCGMGFEFGVAATAMDARRCGYEAFVLTDLCTVIDPVREKEQRAEMATCAVKLIESSDLYV